MDRTEISEKVVELRKRLDWVSSPPGFTLMSEIYAEQVSIFSEVAALMLDSIESRPDIQTVWEAISAIEKKVGVNYSTDQDSMDYRLRQLEKTANPFRFGW